MHTQLLLVPFLISMCGAFSAATADAHAGADPSNSRPSQVALLCSFSLIPSQNLLFPATGGSATIAVRTGPACSWAADRLPPVPWLAVSPQVGVGNGSVRVQVAANTNCANRSASIVIANQGLPLVQLGVSPTFALSPEAASVGSDGGSSTVQLTASCADAAWNVSGAPDWIHFSPTNGTGSQTVGYVVDRNSSASDRSATIIIAGRNFTTTQAARSGPGLVHVDCTYAGMDSDGSLPRPHRTVMAAYQAALSGDTLRLFACNYCETLTLFKPLRLEATNGIVNIGCR